MTKRIAIVGGGFCGAVLALQLLRRAAREVESGPSQGAARGGVPAIWIHLIDGARDASPGLAYSTPSDVHWLNVPTARMSAWPDDPEHFLRWIQTHKPDVRPYSFMPRKLYGQYLRALVDAGVRATSGAARIVPRTGRVRELLPPHSGRGARLLFSDGAAVDADIVVLATGNEAPPDPPGLSPALRESAFYVCDPWRDGTWRNWSADAPLLMVGTGLTMVDVVLERVQRGQVAPIYALSRRGLLPRAHLPQPPSAFEHPDWSWRPSGGTLPSWLREAGRLAALAEELGGDWRCVMDLLRPLTPQLWSALDDRAKRQFLRHLRPYWETHRHRMAPAAAAEIQRLRGVGGLVVLAGRLQGVAIRDQVLAACYHSRGESRTRRLDVDGVINCTGPSSNPAQSRDPLVRQLVSRRLLTPDPAGLGALTDEHGALRDGEGRASTWLFTIGGLRRPSLWEATAVPELRLQADELAVHLLCGKDARTSVDS